MNKDIIIIIFLWPNMNQKNLKVLKAKSNSSTSSLKQLNINSTSTYINPRLLIDSQVSYLHPRRSSRSRKPPVCYGSPVSS